MVELHCPHCEEIISLDDDAMGEFVCPYCDAEFEWGVDSDEEVDDALSYSDSQSGGIGHWIMTTLKAALAGSLFITGIVLVSLSIAGFGLSSSAWEVVASEPSGDSASSIGVPIVMLAILVGFLISGTAGLLGLIALLTGLSQVLFGFRKN